MMYIFIYVCRACTSACESCPSESSGRSPLRRSHTAARPSIDPVMSSCLKEGGHKIECVRKGGKKQVWR